MNLGELEKINLRDIWKDEARDFTPWLAQNIEKLSETIDIEIELEEQEKNVGKYSADIVCRNTQDDSLVVIENQIDRTDHKHLGQLLTYASGLNALTIIWIAQEFNEEHRAAIDWLNENSKTNIHFFALEIEVFKIGISDPAPKFNIVAKPNDTSRSAKEQFEISPRKKHRLKYWTRLKEHINQKQPNIQTRTPSPKNWFDFSIGKSGVFIRLNVTNKEIRIELMLKDEMKDNFSELYKNKDNIEKDLSEKLSWDEGVDKAVSIIGLRKEFNTENEDNWEDMNKWFEEKLIKFYDIFSDFIKKF